MQSFFSSENPDPRPLERPSKLKRESGFHNESLTIVGCILFSFILVDGIILLLGTDFWQDIRAYELNFGENYYYTRFRVHEIGTIGYFTEEILFFYIVDLFLEYGFTTIEALRWISIFSCAILFYVVVKQTQKFAYLLFLLSPVYIDMIVGQNRSALSAALLYVAFTTKKESVRISLIILASMIHFSSLLFGVIYYVYFFFRKAVPLRRLLEQKIVWLFIAFLFAALAEISRQGILEALEDRRADSLGNFETGILMTVNWLLFIASYLFLARTQKATFPFFFYATCTFLFAFSALTGNFALRYVSVAYPMLVLLLPTLKTQAERVLFGSHLAASALIYFTFSLLS